MRVLILSKIDSFTEYGNGSVFGRVCNKMYIGDRVLSDSGVEITDGDSRLPYVLIDGEGDQSWMVSNGYVRLQRR